jgi:sterol desaturase/sphingolipid hydroxylase (fatty acid hydroxylase superfamily)
MGGNEYAGISEGVVRLGGFVAIFGLMGLWELLAPARVRSFPRLRRWPNNLALAALNVAIVRVLFPAAGVGLAVLAGALGAGLLRLLDLPFWLAVLAGVAVLDLAIYLQHLLFHAVPTLWRLHRVHHADPDFDVTTALRFHPIEILLSMFIKAAAIFAFGPPVLAVLLFEIVLNGAAIFNHGNVRLPGPLERAVRWLVVTPDMHRVHHSKDMRETNSNYGFNLSLWDRLFGTYCAQPRLGHTGMQIGVSGLEDPKSSVRLLGLLVQPFRSPREPVEPAERHREHAIGS